MSMPEYRTAIVNGASSGIAAAACRMEADRGVTVHAPARREDRPDALAAETGAIPHTGDVTDVAAPAAAIGGVAADNLISNAGTTHNGRFDTYPPEKIDELLDLNVRAMAGSAPCAASKAAVSPFLDIPRLDTPGTAIRRTEHVPGRVRRRSSDMRSATPSASGKPCPTARTRCSPRISRPVSASPLHCPNG